MKSSTLKKLSSYTTNSSNSSKLVKIGEASELIGVSIDTLRRWEKKGWLKTVKTPGGTRLYDKEQLIKLNPNLKRGPKSLLTPIAPISSTPNIISTASAAPLINPTTQIHLASDQPILKISNHIKPSQIESDIERSLSKNSVDGSGISSFSSFGDSPLINSLKKNLMLCLAIFLLVLPLILLSNYLKNNQTITTLVSPSLERLSNNKLVKTKDLAQELAAIFSPSLSHNLLGKYPPGGPPGNLAQKLNKNSNPAQQRDLADINGGNFSQPQTRSNGQVLAESSPSASFLHINLDTQINGIASVSGELTAPNILYTINPGSNISITGDPQRPTISATTVTTPTATNTTLGIASFSSSFFTVTNGAVSISNSSITNAQIKDGTITNSNLANSGITINAGSGLSGGGTVSLGGSITLSTTGQSSAVTSITGTANQVIASASTGDVTLSLPQDIATTSTPQFSNVTLSALAANGVVYTTGTSALASVTTGSTGECLLSNGAAAPSWGACFSGSTSFTLAGDSGTNQTIGSGDTLTINGDANIATAGVNTDKFSITLGSALTGINSIDTIAVTATGLTFAGTGTINSTTSSAITVDSGTTGAVNLGTGNNAKTINIATGTAGNIVNIATDDTTADTIGVGSTKDTVTLGGTIKLNDGTASRVVLTDASKNLVYSGASSVFAATITDETGTGSVVFNTNPTISGLTLSGTTATGQTAGRFLTTDGSGNLATSQNSAALAATLTDETGTGVAVFSTSPTLVTPNIGAATATSINGLTITTSTGTLTIANAKTFTVSNSLTFTGTDGDSFAFPSGSDTVVTLTAAQTLTNKTIDAGSNTITNLTNSNLSGSAGITNANLANSTITFTGNTGSTAIALGGTQAIVGSGGISTAQSSGTITISCATCVVSGGTLFTLAATSGSNSTISQGDTLTLTAGTDITTTGSGTDGVTIANTSTLGTVTGRGATTSTLVNLDGGIAVDTSNFTVSGTTGAISTASTITANTTGTINGLSINSGTITSGTWNGTPIGTQYGGTGQDFSAVAQGSIPYFNGTGTVATLAPGTSGYVLTTQGTGANPVWTDAGSLNVKWNNIVSPDGNQSLTMSTYTTAWNWATGTSTNNLFSLTTDNSANGTGSLLNIQTGTSSTVLPLRVRAGSTEALIVNAAGNVGVGDTTPDAKVEILSTTEQLRLTETDNTNDSRFTVDSSGNLTIDNTGTKTVVADDFQVTGNDILDSGATSRITLGATTTLTNTTTTLSGTSTITASSLTTLTTAATLAMSSTTTLNLGTAATINAAATSLNIQTDGAIDVNIAGGSASTGCTVANATGNLTCSGNIAGGSTGTVGYWTRGSGLVYPSTTTDSVVVGGTTTSGGDIVFNDGGSAVFNEQGGAVDFRVEGDTISNLLLVTGSSDKVSIGASPLSNASRFSVSAALTSASASYDNGSRFETTVSSITDTYGAVGLFSGNINTHTANAIADQRALDGQTMFSSVMAGGATTVAVTTAKGVNGENGLIGASPVGTITNAMALAAGPVSNAATGSPDVRITNKYGLFVYDQGSGSGSNGLTITSAAGAAIADVTSATNKTNLLIGNTTIPSGTYSIYNSSASDNYIAGNTGVGTLPTTSQRLIVSGTSTSSSVDQYSALTGLNTVSSTNAGSIYESGNFFLGSNSSHTTNSFISRGVQSNAQFGSVMASQATEGISDASSFFAIQGFGTGARGTVTSSSGFYAYSPFNSNSVNVTVTNKYGMKIDNQGTVIGGGSGLTISSAAGLAIADTTGATNNTNLLLGTQTIPSGTYSLFSASSSNNFFNGNVGIGDSSPTAKLEVGDGTDSLQVSSVGDITFVDANGGAGITGPAGGSLTITAPNTSLELQVDGSVDVNIAGGSSATGCTVANATGNLTCSGNAAINGGTVSTNASTGNLFNTNAATLNIGGASTTALNIGNGNSAYTAINIGSGTGGNTINVAGTGATGADTINIGTGGTAADTITIGNNASTTALNFTSGTGSQTFTSSNVTGATTSSSFVFNSPSLTSGTALRVTSTSTSGKLVDLNASNTSGTIFNLAYGASKTLSGDLTGFLIDLDSGQVDATNQNLTGVNFKIPTVTDTHTSGTKTLTGMLVNFGNGAGINQNGSGGTLEYVASDLYLPALTQTAGTLNAYGTRVTTPASITTGGTAYGNYVSASGVGAGNLNGLGISSITGGAGTEYALNIGSGWDATLRVGSTTVIDGSGVTQVAGGGTGIASYTTGDLIYASGATTLAKRAIGNTNDVLTVVGGVPTWTTISGSSCTNCLVNNPTATQTISPTNDSTGLSVRQTTAVSPTADIFNITDSTGSTKYFYVDKDGNVSTGAISNTTLTLTPTGNQTALTLVGTNVTSAKNQYINTKNSSGTISDLSYGAAQTLSGSIIGQNIDLSTNVTATNQSETGLAITLAGATNTSGTQNYRGISISGGAINENGGTATNFYGADITIPALTQTSGTLTAYGANINTPSSITTDGTSYALNINATGVSTGTSVGVNIGSITNGGAGSTETAMQIGSGWDTNLLFNDTTTNVAVANGGTITILDTAGNSLCTITDAGSVGNLNCTGTIGGAGSVGFWSRDAGTGILTTANAEDVVSLSSNKTSTPVLALTSTGATSNAFTLTGNSITTGNLASLTATGLTTGEIMDITGTWAPSDGSDNEGIDVNLTYTPTSSAGTFRGLDLNVTEGANALANTLYGAKITADNSANTSTGTHTIYGGHFTATGKTAGTTAAVGIYSTASGADVNYAALFDNGNVGIGDLTPDAKLNVDLATLEFVQIDASTTTSTFTSNTSGVFDIQDTVGNVNNHASFHISQTVNNGANTGNDVFGQRIRLTSNDADVDVEGLYIVSTDTANAGAGTFEAGIHIDHLDTTSGSMLDGVRITAASADAITDALDVSDAEITNALNAGANTITGAGYLITSTSSGLTINSTSADLAFTTTTSGNFTFTPSAASGLLNVLTGNLKVGDGTPTLTQDGEDAYVEGTFEVDGVSTFASNVGVGDTTPDAKVEILSTTEQLRLTETDNTNDSRFTVDSSGNLTIDNTGTKTVVADDFQVTGNDILDSGATSRITLGSTTTLTNSTTTLSGTSTITASSLSTLTTAASLSATSTTTFTLGTAATINSNGTSLNLQADGAVDVNIAGGSSATGCTVANSTGNLTCTGSITGSSSGTVGFWQRSGTTIKPATSTDSLAFGSSDQLTITNAGTLSTTGNISTTSSGAITSAGTLTASNGFTMSTGALSMTASSGSAAWTLSSSTTAFNINSGLFTVDTTNSRVGIGDASPDAKLDIEGAISGTPGSTGAWLNSTAGTFTDNNTGASGTATIFTANSFQAPTLAATNASVTTSAAATVYIAGEVAAGSNQTITTPLALLVTGRTYLNPTSTLTNSSFITLNVAPIQSTANSAAFYGANFTPSYTAASGNTLANLYGITSIPANSSSGTVTDAYAVFGRIDNTSSGIITTANGLYGIVRNTSTGQVATGYGLRIGPAVNSGGGTFTANYGGYIEAQTAGGSDYGLRIDAADTQTLWVSGATDTTTAAAGIAFGASRDTNLYRSAANSLYTDDSFTAAGSAITSFSTTNELAALNGADGGIELTDSSDDFTYVDFKNTAAEDYDGRVGYSSATNTMGFYNAGSGSVTASLSATALTLAGNVNFTMNSGTGVYTQTYTGTSTASSITANSIQTNNIMTLTGTGFTTGSVLSANGTFSPTAGGTISANQFNTTYTPTTTAGTLRGLSSNFTDSGTLAGTSSISGLFFNNLTGNAASKTAYGVQGVTWSSITTADITFGGYTGTSVTGAISTGTRTSYGLMSNPTSTAASTGGTLNMYGGYFNPSSTLSNPGTGDTTTNNIYGVYTTPTATVASDCTTNCTTNQYGVFVADGTSSTNGTSTKYGIYINRQTGADRDDSSTGDRNYHLYVNGGTTATANTNQNGGYFGYTATPASTTSANTFYDSLVSSAVTTANGIDQTNTNLRGVVGSATYSGNNTLGASYASVASFGWNSTGTISNAYGFHTSLGTNSGTITNTYGVYIGDVTNGTQTNQAYGLYQVDTGARNYFAGSVGIGDNSPSSALEVGNGTDSLQVSSVGDLTFVDADGAASITGPNGGALAISGGTSQAINITSNAASTYALPSNTATAFRFTDGTNAYHTIDTRTGTSGVAANLFATGTAPSFASGASTRFNSSVFTPGTVTLTGTTQVTSTGTSANNAILFNQPTIAGNGTRTVDEASNIFINGATIASSSSGTGTISVSSALRIGAGSSLAGTGGAVTTANGLYIEPPAGASENRGLFISYPVGTTFSGTQRGFYIDGSANVTNAASPFVGGLIITPTTTALTGQNIRGYLTNGNGAVTSSSGTNIWSGFAATIPTQTQSGGTLTTYGLQVTGGTLNSGTSYGVHVDMGTAAATKYAGAFVGGNVGIGTSTPTSLLHVTQTSAATTDYTLSNLTLLQNADGNGAFTALSAINTMTAAASGSNDALYGIQAGAKYQASSGTVAAARGIYVFNGSLTSGGTITQSYGIDIASPTATGTVTDNTGLYVEAQTTATNNIGLTIAEATGTKNTNLLIGTTSQPTGSYSIYNSSTDSNYFAGNVGIGVSTPAFKFDMANAVNDGFVAQIANTNGTVTDYGLRINAGASGVVTSDTTTYMIGFYDSTGANLIGGVIRNGGSTVTYNTGSDRRIKSDIRDTHFGLSDLMKVNIRDYRFTTDETRQNRTGYIAQELYEIYPEAVSKPADESKQIWTVDYGRITPLIIKGVQELNYKVENALLAINPNGQANANLDVASINVSGDINVGGLVSASNFALDASALNRTGSLASVPVNSGKVTIADAVNTLNNQQSTINSKVLGLEADSASQSTQIAQNNAIAQQAISQAQSLDEKVASTSGKLDTLSDKINELLANLGGTPQEATGSSTPDSGLTPPDLLLATGSATLANINVTEKASTLNLEAMDATISATFKSLGETFLGQTTIAGDLSIDGTMSFTNGNSINAFPTLFLQNNPLAQAIDIFNGKVTIDKTGLFATEALALGNQSLGEATIPAGQTEITINSSLINGDSRIFLTPTSGIQGNLYPDTKVNGQSFKVKLSQPNSQDVKFNWMIVQSK